MEPFDMLSDDDKDLIETWIKDHANHSNYYWGEGPDLTHIFRFWNCNKKDLFEMFGKKFILTKEVSFKIGDKELKDAMDEMMSEDAFCEAYSEAISPIYKKNNGFDIWLRLSHLLRSDILVKNQYDMGTCIVPGEWTVDGKPVKIQEGCRPIRTLAKLCRAFGLDEQEFEKFRLKHSQILNTEVLSGELCLSIHPMDYMTMSDNDCGWDSCMSWVKAAYSDGGEYRLGTVEMMNSPCVVVAYLKSHTDMAVRDYPRAMFWNNKRWRQLVIVNKDIILGNHQYPYVDDSLEGTVLSWLRELASEFFETRYEETLTDLRNGTTNENTYFDFSTTFMYNDIYDIRHAYVAESTRELKNYRLNFSGEASCMVCGKVIDRDERPETSSVCCAECGGYEICDDCGLWLEDDYAYWHDGVCYCEDCYRDHVDYCEMCRMDVSVGAVRTYAVSCEGSLILDWQISMCDDCYEEYKDDNIPDCVDIDKMNPYHCYEVEGCHSHYAYDLCGSAVGSQKRADLLSKIFS